MNDSPSRPLPGQHGRGGGRPRPDAGAADGVVVTYPPNPGVPRRIVTPTDQAALRLRRLELLTGAAALCWLLFVLGVLLAIPVVILAWRAAL